MSTILTTSSSPPLNYDIYSHVIHISLDILTTCESCASVNDFRIAVIARMIPSCYKIYFHNYTYLQSQIPVVTFVQIGTVAKQFTCSNMRIFHSIHPKDVRSNHTIHLSVPPSLYRSQ